MTVLPFALLGYLLGSLPFAVIVSKLFGLADPRTFGSGNPGATNVLRTGNKAAAVLTLLGDALKGWLAMGLAAHFGADATGVALAALCAFTGHVYPVFLRFKGGKGVATAAGVFFGFNVWLGVAALAAWIAVAAVFRYSSLAAIAAATVTPLAAWFLLDTRSWAVVLAICLLVIVRHRDNIGRLLSGAESRIGAKKTS